MISIISPKIFPEDHADFIAADTAAVDGGDTFDFFEFPELNNELRKLAIFPPGEIGCFTFFKPAYNFRSFKFYLIYCSLKIIHY